MKKSKGGENMDVQQFGSFLQQRRKQLSMTQAELADRLHVTDKAISRWERGIGFPDIKLLEPLAEELELTLTELLKCEVMEKPLPETAKAESQQIMQQQITISRKRKVALWIGQGAILCAAFVLVHISRQRGLSFGLQFAAYAIALLGTFFASLSLRFIVGKMYLNPQPWGDWGHIHRWIAWTMETAGVLITVFARRLSGNAGLLLMLLGCVLVGGGILYERIMKERQEE